MLKVRVANVPDEALAAKPPAFARIGALPSWRECYTQRR
jgi:hypothetical protein